MTPRRILPRLLLLGLLGSGLLALGACDEGRHATNPFGGPYHGPTTHTLPRGSIPWNDAPQPP